MTGASIRRLDDLRGFRCAPSLTPEQREGLRAELRQRLDACDWCTIGIMAPSSAAALEALRSFERALGWPPLEADSLEATNGPVFLKGHQRNASLRAREEAGLGEGVLITGHSDVASPAADTWGPLPLDLFADAPPASSPEEGDGTTAL
ncbi:MAG: DUF1824 family protein [Cyanobacteriota bacterium]|nr:DUF1824 family protein [Cyanobacteriota bacterium]